MSIKLMMPSNHLILCHPLLPSSIFPSIRVFSNESILLIRWPKYWSFSFSFSPSMNIQDWFPLGWSGWISLQSKGLSRVFSNTTVQKHILRCSAFFTVQLSHPYMTLETEKNLCSDSNDFECLPYVKHINIFYLICIYSRHMKTLLLIFKQLSLPLRFIEVNWLAHTASKCQKLEF